MANPTNIPNEYQRDFIRGYFDGDGWFTNTEKCFQVGIIGTENFISGFLEKVKGLINTNNTIFEVHRENGAKRYVFGSYNDVSNFLNWIYKDSNIFLDRKYNQYLDFIKNGSKYHKK